MRTDKEIIEAVYAGENLTESELKYLRWELGMEVDSKEGDEGRWTRCISTIMRLPNPENMDEFLDDLWCLDWERGLTEHQENIYSYQPYRVEAFTRTITITDYIPIEKDQ